MATALQLECFFVVCRFTFAAFVYTLPLCNALRHTSVNVLGVNRPHMAFKVVRSQETSPAVVRLSKECYDHKRAV